MVEVLHEAKLPKRVTSLQEVVHKMELVEVERQIELKEARMKLDQFRNGLLHEHGNKIQQLLHEREMQQTSVLDKAKTCKPEASDKQWGLGVGYSSAEPGLASYHNNDLAALIEEVKLCVATGGIRKRGALASRTCVCTTSQLLLANLCTSVLLCEDDLQWGVHLNELAAVKNAQEELGVLVKDAQDQMGMMMKLFQQTFDEIKSHLLLRQANANAMADNVSTSAPCGPVPPPTPATLNAADVIALGDEEGHIAAAIIRPAQSTCDHMDQQAVHLPGVPWFASLPISGILLGMADSDTLLEQVTSVVQQGLLATQEAVGATQEAGAATAATAAAAAATLLGMHEAVHSPVMPREDACAAPASAQALTQAIQPPGPSGAASCSPATASGLAAAPLSPAADAFDLDAEPGQQGNNVTSLPWYDAAPAPSKTIESGALDSQTKCMVLLGAGAASYQGRLVMVLSQSNGEYVPTMSWWDPAVASACLAAASGEPVHQSTMPLEVMLKQEDVANPLRKWYLLTPTRTSAQ
ncbi:TPA: hypothetical protein ACH3X1_007056 [Trebouxia sp. C0004]